MTGAKTDPSLIALLEKARSHKMTPEEIRAQRRSYVAAEMGFGSDSDEAALRAAIENVDVGGVARLRAASDVRQSQAFEVLNRLGL